MDIQLLLSVVLGISILLILILRLKISAFLALLIASIAVGLFAGMPAMDIIESVRKGMGDTLGFVATIVGLGALFGAILEHSGGAQAIASMLIRKFGIEKSPYALAITGFIVAIPVFFDVAFVILVPLVYAMHKKTGKSLLKYAMPLLAGLAITHTFIPPTPGPVAVADIIGANLGYVILFGFLAGIPTLWISAIWFGKKLGDQIDIGIPEYIDQSDPDTTDLPSAGQIIAIIALPILLILINTIISGKNISPLLSEIFSFAGHPFVALIIANILAWYLLGIRRGFTKEILSEISTKSLAPAGLIILLTGAGGVLKQVLIDTGVGTMIAESLQGFSSSPVVFGFVIAALVRLLQGSATVAMITAAGMTAPFFGAGDYSEMQLALVVIAIASGATFLSHVNDSAFWLVNRYLGMTEKQTFRSWSLMTSLIAVVGFFVTWLMYLFV